MHFGRTFVSIAGGLLLAATVACEPAGRIHVRIGPPAPLVERIPVAPAPGYVWVPGYYRWDGRAYIWTPGRYVLPPQRRATWVPAHWARDRHGWYFVEGHWR